MSVVTVVASYPNSSYLYFFVGFFAPNEGQIPPLLPQTVHPPSRALGKTSGVKSGTAEQLVKD